MKPLVWCLEAITEVGFTVLNVFQP